MTIAEAIYLLCAGTGLIAAILLLRQYRLSGSRLLLWSFIGFIGLSANNILVYLDLVVVQSTDLAVPRAIAGALGVLALLYGLIWEART
jgi:hypothetical protein